MSSALPTNGESVDGHTSRPGFAIEPTQSRLQLLILQVTDGRLVVPPAGAEDDIRPTHQTGWQMDAADAPDRSRSPQHSAGAFAPGVDRSLPWSAPLDERTIRLHSALRKLVYGIEHLCCPCDLSR
jgi:hypothetical protein